MQRFELTTELLTHHAVIDAQHRALVDILNEAAVSVAACTTLSAFPRLTAQLLDYAAYHFATEEDLMVTSAYIVHAPADARLHVDEHRGFAARVVAMRAEFASDPRQVGGQVLVRFLQDWLVHHIGESDAALGHYLAAAGSGRPSTTSAGGG